MTVSAGEHVRAMPDSVVKDAGKPQDPAHTPGAIPPPTAVELPGAPETAYQPVAPTLKNSPAPGTSSSFALEAGTALPLGITSPASEPAVAAPAALETTNKTHGVVPVAPDGAAPRPHDRRDTVRTRAAVTPEQAASRTDRTYGNTRVRGDAALAARTAAEVETPHAADPDNAQLLAETFEAFATANAADAHAQQTTSASESIVPPLGDQDIRGESIRAATPPNAEPVAPLVPQAIFVPTSPELAAPALTAEPTTVHAHVAAPAPEAIATTRAVQAEQLFPQPAQQSNTEEHHAAQPNTNAHAAEPTPQPDSITAAPATLPGLQTSQGNGSGEVTSQTGSKGENVTQAAGQTRVDAGATTPQRATGSGSRMLPPNTPGANDASESSEGDRRPQITLRGNELTLEDTPITISAHEVTILRALMATTHPVSAVAIAVEMGHLTGETVSHRPLGKATSKLARFLLDTYGSDIILITMPRSKKLPTTYQLNPAFRFQELAVEEAPQERVANPYRIKISAVPQRLSEARDGIEETIRIRTDHSIVNAQGQNVRLAEGNPLSLFNIVMNSIEPQTIDQLRVQGFETTDADPARRCREAMRKLRSNLADLLPDVDIIQRIETPEGVKFGFNPAVRVMDERDEYEAQVRSAEKARTARRSAQRHSARHAEAQRRQAVEEQRRDNPYYQGLTVIPQAFAEERPNAYTVELINDYTFTNLQGDTLQLEGNSLYLVNVLLSSSEPLTIEDMLVYGFTTQSPDAAKICGERIRELRARFISFSGGTEIIQRIETQEGNRTVFKYVLNPNLHIDDRREELAAQRWEEARERQRQSFDAEAPVVYHSAAEIKAARRDFVVTTYNAITQAGRELEAEHPNLGISLDRAVAESLDKPYDIVRDLLVIDRVGRALDIDLSPQSYPDILDVDAYKRTVFRLINRVVNATELTNTEKLLFGMHLGLPPSMNTYHSLRLLRRDTDDEIPYERYYRWTQSQRENHGRNLQLIRDSLFSRTRVERLQEIYANAVEKVKEELTTERS